MAEKLAESDGYRHLAQELAAVAREFCEWGAMSASDREMFGHDFRAILTRPDVRALLEAPDAR